MRWAWWVLALALLAAPLGAQQADSIPIPWPVAPSGVSYQLVIGGEWVEGVIVGGDVWSSHQRLDTAIRAAGAYIGETCRWECPAIWVVPAPLRVDVRAAHWEGEPDPEPYPIDPEPYPIAEWSADSTTIYPSEEEGYQPASLAWMGGTPHLCVTDIESGSVGWIEVELQEVDLEPYWVVTYPGAAWWPGECADPQANIAGEPSQWIALYPVVEEPTPALAHVTGSTVENSAGATVTALQVQHEHVAGTRLYFSVGVRGEIDTSAVSASVGGVAMDLLAFERPAGTDVVAHAWFMLANPPIGASEVAVTLDFPRRITVAAVSVAGVSGERVVGAASASGMTSPETVVVPLSVTFEGELLLTGLHWRNSASFPSQVDPGAVLTTDQGFGGQNSRGGVLVAEPTGAPTGISITDGSGNGIHFGAHAATVLAIQVVTR